MGRLKILDRYDSPVREASGLCCFTIGEAEHLAVVGDRDTTLSWASLTPEGPGKWKRLPLGDLDGVPDDIGQLEAVAAAGDGRVVVLGEEPALLVLIDVGQRAVVGWWRISVAETPDFAELWDRDENSRGEGLILLPEGHALVLKEKNPVVAIEVGPGTTRRSQDVRDVPTTWDPPDGHGLQVVHWIEVADAPADVSDCEAVAGTLYALSDQDRCVVELRHDQESLLVGRRWDLDRKVEKPEGLTVTSVGDWYVAMDTPDGKMSLVRVEAPGE